MNEAEHKAALIAQLEGSHRGVVAAIRRDGRPQLSNVVYAFDPTTRLVRFSTTAGRAKAHNLRRDPRASFYVCDNDFWKYVVADATCELVGPAEAVDDEVVDELVDIYRAIGGEHPNWDEYREEMVRDRRLVVRLNVDRVYGKS
ncbi:MULTISPECIES: PPOX class F420-dependent oxidoreductase [unclassified Nocardioides]|uniref:PPOX class F420-dependent oxidoreductase n=1 Tax=unclassified Nocardioides TaxID=2615069 RepID=UPI0009F05958|nr:MULTISPECIES: PPOX class F420-dependent oxidoreductase [unclassified Nocardioides]GAW47988.1 Pyridoxine 5'-phosphate oxidase [Nocardioides sp. PD653-B2]GAW53709.1 Pyridoxine 5'-phosphate oxidase [Nocardioides sp. PD653]